MKPYAGKVPFDRHDGKARMMEYTHAEPGHSHPDRYGYPREWRDNYVFEATLSYGGYHKGRSSARVYLDTPTERYSMTIHEFDLHVYRMAYGKLSGKWTFRKQGANYCLVGA